MALVCAMVTAISHLSVTVLCQGATRRNLPCERAMIAIVYVVVVLCSGNSSLQRGFRSSAMFSVPRLEKAILGLHEYHIHINLSFTLSRKITQPEAFCHGYWDRLARRSTMLSLLSPVSFPGNFPRWCWRQAELLCTVRIIPPGAGFSTLKSCVLSSCH